MRGGEGMKGKVGGDVHLMARQGVGGMGLVAIDPHVDSC